MINSGTESSRLLQRGAPLIRPKLFPLPTAPCVSQPHAARSGASFSWGKAVDGLRLPQEPEGTSGSDGLTEPWVSLPIPPMPPAQPLSALVTGIARCPSLGLQVGLSTKSSRDVQREWHIPTGSGLTPALANTGVHTRARGRRRGCSSCPQRQIPTASPPHSHLRAAQGYTCRNSALLAVSVGKGVLKGKSLWGKEIDRGIAPPFLFMAARLHAAYRQRSIPRRANYRKERSQSQGWAVLHLIFLIQSHRL